jgi:hypothetical protein
MITSSALLRSRPAPLTTGGSPGLPGSTPMSETSWGSARSPIGMDALEKPIGPTSRTPSTARIARRVVQSTRLAAIDNRAVSW